MDPLLRPPRNTQPLKPLKKKVPCPFLLHRHASLKLSEPPLGLQPREQWVVVVRPRQHAEPVPKACPLFSDSSVNLAAWHRLISHLVPLLLA